MKGISQLDLEISEYNGIDYAKMTVTLHKKPVRTKESIHFAMPFNLHDASVRFDAGEGMAGPDFQQLPGANRDYFSVQRWISLNGKEGNVTIVSPQAALFEVGEMVNENKVLNGYKQGKTSASSSALLFVYALNNYWHTNFKADQEGPVQFDVYLRFGTGPFKQAEAERFARFCLNPCTAPPLYRQNDGALSEAVRFCLIRHIILSF